MGFIVLQTTLFADNHIAYIHKDVAIDSITDESINWENLEKPIYDGFNNGVYWFKMELEPSETDRIISIPESHITRAQLFDNNTEVEMLTPTRYAAFQIPSTNTIKTYYLRVNCLLEARIPIEIKETRTYYKSEIIEGVIIAIYFGVIFSIILFNIFSFYSFGNKTYLFYIFMVIGMSVNAFYKDGVTAYLFGIDGVNEILEPLLNAIVCISAIFFTITYLEIEDRLKTIKILGISVVALALIFNVIFQITGNFGVFTLIHICHLLSLTIFLSAGFFLWKESFFARFFVLAYGLPLFFAYDYYISPHFGIIVLDLPLNVYKLGSLVEMIVFTFAIMYQAKKLNLDNKEMRQKLIDYTKSLEQSSKGILEREATAEELIEKFNLTIKEIEILKTLSLGKTNKEIATMQFISENTVKYHIKNICKKLEVSSKKDAKYKYLNYSTA